MTTDDHIIEIVRMSRDPSDKLTQLKAATTLGLLAKNGVCVCVYVRQARV